MYVSTCLVPYSISADAYFSTVFCACVLHPVILSMHFYLVILRMRTSPCDLCARVFHNVFMRMSTSPCDLMSRHFIPHVFCACVLHHCFYACVLRYVVLRMCTSPRVSAHASFTKCCRVNRVILRNVIATLFLTCQLHQMVFLMWTSPMIFLIWTSSLRGFAHVHFTTWFYSCGLYPWFCQSALDLVLLCWILYRVVSAYCSECSPIHQMFACRWRLSWAAWTFLFWGARTVRQRRGSWQTTLYRQPHYSLYLTLSLTQRT